MPNRQTNRQNMLTEVHMIISDINQKIFAPIIIMTYDMFMICLAIWSFPMYLELQENRRRYRRERAVESLDVESLEFTGLHVMKTGCSRIVIVSLHPHLLPLRCTSARTEKQ